MQETPRKVFLVGLTTSQANLTYELEELGLNGLEDEYVISFNGAVLSENKDNKIFQFNGLTFEKVKEIIMDTINCSEDKITLEANLKDDLGIDSLDSMELMMAVEDAYGITVPEEELPNLTSVKAIVEYVDKNAA